MIGGRRGPSRVSRRRTVEEDDGHAMDDMTMGALDAHAWAASLWRALTRLGEAQILLPAFIAGVAWLLFLARSQPEITSGTVGRIGSGTLAGDPARAAAVRWLAGIVAGTLLTTASKVAFLGFGIGWAALDFTGVSGHAMYASAILPVLAALVAGRVGAACGWLVAVGVMVSRIEVHAHSWSEVLVGTLVGTAIASATLARLLGPRSVLLAPWWLPLLLAAWLTVVPWRAPPSRAHDAVVRLSLWLSGREVPYTRADMLRDARRDRERDREAARGAAPAPFAGTGPALPGSAALPVPGDFS
jgi:membrane-associated phospholipid phosphatase